MEILIVLVVQGQAQGIHYFDNAVLSSLACISIFSTFCLYKILFALPWSWYCQNIVCLKAQNVQSETETNPANWWKLSKLPPGPWTVQVTQAMLWRLPDKCTEPHKQLSLGEMCHDRLADHVGRFLSRGSGNPVYSLVQNTTNKYGMVSVKPIFRGATDGICSVLLK